MHAEKCPICNGTGKYQIVKGLGITAPKDPQPCQGCNGKGWIEVKDESSSRTTK